MKKNILCALTLLSAMNLSAQEVISTQGDTYNNANGSIDFTIGEVIINTESDGNHDVTQGFHQSNWNFVSVENHAPNYTATIFPNPAEEVLNVKTNAFENVRYTLYNAQGEIVLQNQLTNELTPIDVNHLAPGSYSLILMNDSQSLKTFKLIKHSK